MKYILYVMLVIDFLVVLGMTIFAGPYESVSEQSLHIVALRIAVEVAAIEIIRRMPLNG